MAAPTASPLNFGGVNVCPPGSSSPAPCSKTAAVTLKIVTSGTLGTPNVLTLGSPNLDFRLASGGTCTTGAVTAGETCTVNVTFTPSQAGLRMGGLQITDMFGDGIGTALIYGTGNGPQIAFGPGAETPVGVSWSQPARVAVDGAGDVYVADAGNNRVVEISAAGGALNTVGFELKFPTAVAIDGAGDVFIADTGNARVVEVPNSLNPQIDLGSGWVSPVGVAVDAAGNVFVADDAANRVVKIPASGGAQVVLGTGLSSPRAVAVDGAGNVYIADAGNSRVLKIPAGGGKQVAIGAGLNVPKGVAVDAAGDVVIADSGNDRVVEVPAGGGEQFTVASQLSDPRGITVDGAGNLFIADTGNNRVFELPRSQAPALSFDATLPGSTSADSPHAVIVQNIGNQPLNLTGLIFPADFPEAEGPLAACTKAETLSPGHICELSVDFTPRFAGQVNESVALTDNSLNVAAATQSVALSGVGTGTTPVLTWHAPAAVPFGTALSATQLNATASVPGTFKYSPAAGVVLPSGTHTLTATFTPTNRIAYTLAAATVQLTVIEETVSIGSTSAATPYTFAFSSAVTLGAISVVTQGAKGQDFADAGTGTCKAGGSYAAGSSCTVRVTFAPKYAGRRLGAVQLTAGGSVLATQFISGMGVGPQVEFAPGTVTALNPAVGGSTVEFSEGVAADGLGDVFITDYDSHRVVEVPAGGGAATAIAPVVNGVGLSSPIGIAVDGAGDLYIADELNNRVVKVPAGNGAPSAIDPLVDGLGLSFPFGLAVDGTGGLFIVDNGHSRVVSLPADGGAPSAIAPKLNGSNLLVDPTGVAVDSAGNLFIGVYGKAIGNPVGSVVQVPASGGAPVVISPVVNGQGLIGTRGVAVDGAGDLLIADGSRVIEVPAGKGPPFLLYPLPNASLGYPEGVAVDGAGTVFIASFGSDIVVELHGSTPASLSFASTIVGNTSSDSPKKAQVQNIGNQPLKLTGLSYPTDFPEAAGDASACTGTTSLVAGEHCDLPVDFMPGSLGSFAQKVTLTDNSLNLAGAMQSIAVSGTGTKITPAIQWPAPAAISYPTALSATQLDATSPVPGTFVYSPAAGTVPGMGAETLTATFTPTDAARYLSVTKTVQLTVRSRAVSIGSASGAEPVVFTFSSPLTVSEILVVTQGAAGRDFTNVGGGTCKTSTTYAGGSSCTVNVKFAPKFAGLRMGAVELVDSGGFARATQFIQGFGNGPQIVFVPGTATVIDATVDRFPVRFSLGTVADGAANLFLSNSFDIRKSGAD